MPLPARTELVGDPAWLDSLLDATRNGVSLEAYTKLDATPCKKTVCRWLYDRDDILTRFARARQVAARTTLAHRIEVTANGPLTPDGEYDVEADTSVRVSRDKLKVDTLRYLAGVYDPDTFGDARHKVGVGNVNIVVQTGVPAAASEERQRLIVEAAQPPQLPVSQDDTSTHDA